MRVSTKSSRVTSTPTGSVFGVGLGVWFGVGALAIAACGSPPKPVAAPSSEAAAPSGKGSGIALEGECVDPVADGDRHDSTRPADHHVQLDVRQEDIDGDGVVDFFVKPAWACGHGCFRSAYVARGTCGHYVGTFPSEDNWQVLDSKSHGLSDIKARPSKSDGQALRCFQIVYQFDGKQYEPNKHRECECKDEAPKCEADWSEGGIPL